MSIMILSIRGTFHCINMLSTLSVFPCLNITKHYQLIKITRYILQCKKYGLLTQFLSWSVRCCLSSFTLLLLCALNVSLRCKLDPVLTKDKFYTCGHGCSIISESKRNEGFRFALSCRAGCGIHHKNRFKRLTYLVPEL